MTFRELTYLVLDEVKQLSDDAYFTEDHVIFLLSKYRAFLLKQKYADIKKQIPETNYQTIQLELKKSPPIITGGDELDFLYLVSEKIVPIPMQVGMPRVFKDDYLLGEITYITRDRLRYVGTNKYMNKIAYCAILPDDKLYIKCSDNSTISNITTAKFTAIFLDCISAIKYDESILDVMDSVFPIEDSLVSPIVELCARELLMVSYRPQDTSNNSKDDLSDIASFVRSNMKNNYQKQIED